MPRSAGSYRRGSGFLDNTYLLEAALGLDDLGADVASLETKAHRLSVGEYQGELLHRVLRRSKARRTDAKAGSWRWNPDLTRRRAYSQRWLLAAATGDLYEGED